MISATSDCTGCNACVQKCPNNCIILEENKYGFLYPKVDETRCISCNICDRVCHLQNYIFRENTPIAYAAVHKDNNVVLKSTSGGVFSAIAEEVLSSKGVVYGCAFDDNLRPQHIRVDNLSELSSLFGSKYVQSDIGNCYQDILRDLHENRTVFFTGTPCQVAGLKTFLGKDYERLITADLICHGVPSYAYFRKFIKWYEKKNNCKIVDYSFRSKDNAGWSLAGTYTVEKNGKKIVKKVFYYDNYYYHYFLNGDIYRDSCYNCKYANIYRPGDFTLGDLWGAEKIKCRIDINNGCSLLLVNSKKGESLMQNLNVDYQMVSLDFALENNKQLYTPSPKTTNRDGILREYCTCSAGQIQKNYCCTYRMKRVVAHIKYHIPKNIRRILTLLK
jgi:coenzyme F420-reducing hydrogenase beta subunit